MAKGKARPTPDQLRALIDYDPEAGTMFWRHRDISWFLEGKRAEVAVKVWNKIYEGKPCFTYKNELGYPRGHVLQFPVKAHHVAWAIYYGEWPTMSIDHVNGDVADFRIANLRACTMSENQQNRKFMQGRTTKGVFLRPDTGKYQAYITKRFILGSYDTEEEAIRAYDDAAEKLFGEFSKTNAELILNAGKLTSVRG